MKGIHERLADAIGDTTFSDEERNGRYVDMIALHTLFLSLKKSPRLSYVEYLNSFENSDMLDEVAKRSQRKAYSGYVASVAKYLRSFFERAKPLEDLQAILENIQEEFAERWKEKQQQEQKKKNAESKSGHGGEEDAARLIAKVDAAKTLEEILALDPEWLKVALKEKGLKCGGTPRQRAERLVEAKQYASYEDIPRKLKPKSKSVQKASLGGQAEWERDVALQETLIEHFSRHLLRTEIEETKAYIHRKNTRTERRKR